MEQFKIAKEAQRQEEEQRLERKKIEQDTSQVLIYFILFFAPRSSIRLC
jgi:hypothetical protein